MKSILFTLMAILSLPGCKEKEVSATKTGTTKNKDSSKVVENRVSSSLREDLQIYRVSGFEMNGETNAFISVSDNYFDSGSVPPEVIKNQKKIPFEQLKYIQLDAPYRAKMLAALQLKERDTLYVFNYQTAKVHKTPISQLKSVAYLSYYIGEGEDLDDGSYMLGFEVERGKDWLNIADLYDNTLAYFGDKNPFVENQMVNIRWKEIKVNNYADQIPTDARLKKGKSYIFTNQHLTYYLQDYLEGEEVILRNLVVVDQQNQIFFKKSYNINFEGRAFNSLNGIEDQDLVYSQWTGTMFKNTPPVIFGFTSESFGCSVITIMSAAAKEIPIYCDNRH